jgi:hypothetical protein
MEQTSMSDRVPTWIEIGGQVPRKLAPELIDCIERESLRDDFDGARIAAKTADDLVALARDDDGQPGTLKLYDDRAKNGQFEELEWLLERHQVAFDRRSDGGDEFSPELVRYRPAWPAPTTTLLDALGREVILTEFVVEVLQMLRAGQTAEAIVRLAELAEEGVPALKPLEFVD